MRKMRTKTTQPHTHRKIWINQVGGVRLSSKVRNLERSNKKNSHTYLRFDVNYFHPVLFKIIMLVSFLLFSLRFIKHFEPSFWKKVKMSTKLKTQGFYHFQFHSIWKKLLWILYKMLRYLVRILHPQIFSLSSVVGHFLKIWI